VIETVSDDEILEAYKQLASREGIFCEPASAASFAGLVKEIRKGLNLSQQRVVCIITGTGLKDPDLAVSSAAARTIEIEPTVEAVEAVALASAQS
jgi:threonine synthase